MIEKMRKDFESWIEKETGFYTFRTNFPMTKPEDQQYKCHHTNLAWLAWQASSAADKDAARYRWLRDLTDGSAHEEIGNYPGDMGDAAIDEAMQCK